MILQGTLSLALSLLFLSPIMKIGHVVFIQLANVEIDEFPQVPTGSHKFP